MGTECEGVAVMGVNARTGAATCAIPKRPVRGADRIFAKLRTHTGTEAIASLLGSRPTR